MSGLAYDRARQMTDGARLAEASPAQGDGSDMPDDMPLVWMLVATCGLGLPFVIAGYWQGWF